jgi:hypothetical protein
MDFKEQLKRSHGFSLFFIHMIFMCISLLALNRSMLRLITIFVCCDIIFFVVINSMVCIRHLHLILIWFLIPHFLSQCNTIKTATTTTSNIPSVHRNRTDMASANTQHDEVLMGVDRSLVMDRLIRERELAIATMKKSMAEMRQRNNVQFGIAADWSPLAVGRFMNAFGYYSAAKKCIQREITGQKLMKMTVEELSNPHGPLGGCLNVDQASCIHYACENGKALTVELDSERFPAITARLKALEPTVAIRVLADDDGAHHGRRIYLDLATQQSKWKLEPNQIGVTADGEIEIGIDHNQLKIYNC